MTTEMLMPAEALTFLLQLESAGFEIENIERSDEEHDDVFKLTLSGGSPQYEGKRISTSYISDLDERKPECINQSHCINRLHTIEIVPGVE